ncbi:MAG: methionine/alanine import family NSS transporter small subunit [Yaniella sp.]|nr:methionine/alanine import family NSS transporter small subunit [Yaniella sp.]MDN5704173.1 methionine/alanine import family NSS transporter small subunit [Yaniella sp.]MDN5730926.1 methionine/alanine import family NSS transporter small subunit [Yaniella sp.]MDN5742694.1 methionine/alanine import family NSS transporter small subunit [Yaniella sp.]MDN5814416.1 methionine/alanine import family NSS transporter small subunit [Yaniella sp.]MDN5817783.1 methionine/alanine import family NSS transpor
MTAISITMMIIACVTVFGGVIAAVIHLQRNPDDVSGEFGDEELRSRRT